MRALSAILNAILVVAYPLAIWWSLSHYSARGVSLVALALLVPMLLLRFRNADRKNLISAVRVPMIVMTVLFLAALFDDERLVLATPVIVSTVLFTVFAKSLRGKISTIESFARLRKDYLSPAQVQHCRQFTIIWCAFFVLNGAIAGTLAVLELRDFWVLYTGLVAYGLMGVLFGSEYFVRKYKFRNQDEGEAAET